MFIGTGTCGLANGASRIMRRIQSFLADNHIVATLIEVGCVGYCQREVFIDLLRGSAPRLSYCDMTPDNIAELLEEVYLEGNLKNRFLLGRWDDADGSFCEVSLLKDTPFFKHQKKVVLENCGKIDPTSLDAALAAGAFRAATRALLTQTPAEVCDQVLESGLRGRGGAGFLTGQKWRVAHDTVSSQKYVICNADEGDPGAFMDRAVLEGDPFRVLEGMLIAAYAIGASRGYIYCRAEYPLALDRLANAISQAGGRAARPEYPRQPFFLRRDHQTGSGGLCVRRGDGDPLQHRRRTGHAQGETPLSGGERAPRETHGFEQCGNPGQRSHDHRAGRGLVQGIDRHGKFGDQGFRPERHHPEHGLGGGPDRNPASPDHLRHRRRRLPGHRIKAVQIGGPSGGCIPEEHLDVAVDYANLQKLGAMMGSGGMVVMDERSCMVDVAQFFMEFLRNESCGKCSPCREGTTRMFEILHSVSERPVGEELKSLERFRGILHLEELAETVQETSLCGLGQSAANPVLSTLRFFRNEYEAHILENRCPAGVCQGLKTFRIETDLCRAARLARRNAPPEPSWARGSRPTTS